MQFLNPPAESPMRPQVTHAVKLLLLQGLLWFYGVQAYTAFSLSVLMFQDNQFELTRVLDAGNLGVEIVVIYFWAVIIHAAVTWILFRSRLRKSGMRVSIVRWAAGIILFYAAGYSVIQWRWPFLELLFSSAVFQRAASIVSFGLVSEDSYGLIIVELCMAVVGMFVSVLALFQPAIQVRTLGPALLTFAMIFGMRRLVGEFRDWRAQPGLDEYAVYEAIARRNTKRHGIATQVVRECSIQFNDVSGELIRALGAEGAFLDYQKRQHQGCRMQRSFKPGSQLRFFPNDAMSPESFRSFIEAHKEPMLIEIFSRVGFSPDGSRAYLSRISLVQWHDLEHGPQATISQFGTTLTKADGGWEVDYGFEYDEWATLSAKRTEAEQKVCIQAIRTLRGLWSVQ